MATIIDGIVFATDTRNSTSAVSWQKSFAASMDGGRSPKGTVAKAEKLFKAINAAFGEDLARDLPGSDKQNPRG